MKTSWMRSLIASVAVTAALMAMAVPAIAGEEERSEKSQAGGQQDEENFQEADKESSEDATVEDEANGRSAKKDSSTEETGASSEEGDVTTSSHTEDSDGPGKNFDNEGSPRGETSTQCENTHGGTGSGKVYDSTCDGAGSKAGNGSGSAKGRPCAGCVGNADYKEPPGQLNDGDHDGNAGYECDGNNGLARSNPAHTGCKRPTTTNLCPPGTDLAGLPPGPNGCDIPPGELCPPGTDLAGLPPGPNGCDNPPNLCPPGTDLAGLPPGPDGCDLPPGEFCPPGTDYEGLPPGPDGCNDDDVQGRIDKVCPEGTDFAGEDMADVEDCVLGKVIHNGGPKPPLGAVLPFTGGSGILPLLFIGLLMLGIGSASLRFRKQV